MLRFLRDARIDRRAGLIVIVIALLAWALVVYTNIRDFVPDELTPPTQPTP